jgi:DNA-binding CsgD family transcriptional regulator
MGEIEALRTAAHGLPDSQAALSLRRSVGTIRSQRRAAMRKLGARTMAQAVFRAISSGLIPSPAMDRGTATDTSEFRKGYYLRAWQTEEDTVRVKIIDSYGGECGEVLVKLEQPDNYELAPTVWFAQKPGFRSGNGR